MQPLFSGTFYLLDLCDFLQADKAHVIFPQTCRGICSDNSKCMVDNDKCMMIIITNLHEVLRI